LQKESGLGGAPHLVGRVRFVGWSLLCGGPTLEPKETEAAPLFPLARNRSRTMHDLRPRKKKKIIIKKENAS